MLLPATSRLRVSLDSGSSFGWHKSDEGCGDEKGGVERSVEAERCVFMRWSKQNGSPPKNPLEQLDCCGEGGDCFLLIKPRYVFTVLGHFFFFLIRLTVHLHTFQTDQLLPHSDVLYFHHLQCHDQSTKRRQRSYE